MTPCGKSPVISPDCTTRTPPSGPGAHVGSTDYIAELWRQCFAQLERGRDSLFRNEQLDRAEELVRRYLDGRHDLFEQRVAAGRIRDGHGDLQADDIFLLDDGPRILDCIEFSDELRWGDVLNDVAFLAMDLERLGAPDACRCDCWPGIASSRPTRGPSPSPTTTSPTGLPSGPRSLRSATSKVSRTRRTGALAARPRG